MNIALFTRGMSLLGKPRARQTVTRVSSLHGGGMPARHVVLVIPNGSDEGEYYEVSSATLERLEGGATPAWLELEPFEPTDEDHDEIEREFDRRYAERNA